MLPTATTTNPASGDPRPTINVSPASRTAGGSRRCRIALYSHDTKGLGHLRRNLRIAEALASPAEGRTVLLISGAREANAFLLPDGVDCLTLPGYHKDGDQQYRSRSLDLALPRLVALRGRVIRETLEQYEPDVLIVDYAPRGGLGELGPTLASLRARGQTRCVLGLRDILGDAGFVRREWLQARNENAIREYYDRIWIYGDRDFYDPVREYGFSRDIAEKVRFAGYLRAGRAHAAGAPTAECDTGRMALCLLGGGQDGAALAEAFSRAELPPSISGVIIAGPFMPADDRGRLRDLAGERRRLTFINFVADAGPFLRSAEHVVAMGGYNTVCEILCERKRALVVPRINARGEQWLRAERLRERGLLDVLHPTELSPWAITKWLRADAEASAPSREALDFGGAARLPRLVDELLDDAGDAAAAGA